jgi:hypothetical protein
MRTRGMLGETEKRSKEDRGKLDEEGEAAAQHRQHLQDKERVAETQAAKRQRHLPSSLQRQPASNATGNMQHAACTPLLHLLYHNLPPGYLTPQSQPLY